MKILVADDSDTNRALITHALHSLGHEVLAASGGQEAIELFEREHPDLVILDVVMANMDGFECATRLRKIRTDEWIPIIFLSSAVDDESIAKGINAGGDDYLTKPFSEVTLAAKIKAMSRIAEMRKNLWTAKQELQVISTTDTLTGVGNRFHFETTIKDEINHAKVKKSPLALLFVDLDHFKIVNDSLGHRLGDELLKEVARRIKTCLTELDCIARIGGDEFVVLLTNVKEPRYPGGLAQKIIAALAPIYNLEEHSIRITASIGIAYYPEVEINHETFVQNADIAMYHAKELGRNNFQFYTEQLNRKYRQQINLEHELKFALERNQLYLTYQPVFNLLTKKIEGMEALLRWKHPEYGLISPNVFIPIAEETGLIIQIGTWVLRTVCQQGAEWFASGNKDLILSVNLSLHQFLQDNFLEQTAAIIKETKIPTYQLELELTESTVITYTAQLKNAINQLHELGVGISIDDFGTRYSSLTSLRYLPITTLKIDKAFLQNITTDQKNNIIVKSLVALGNSLNLKVIAEGVQSEEQIQFLIVNGCYNGQGFYLSEPLSSDEMTCYLNNKKKSTQSSF